MKTPDDLKNSLFELHTDVLSALAESQVPSRTRQQLRSFASRILLLHRAVDELKPPKSGSLVQFLKLLVGAVPLLKMLKHE